MNEQLLEIAHRAERLVPIPEFDAIERSGSRLRTKRRALVAGAVAAVTAAAALAVVTDRPSVTSDSIDPTKTTDMIYTGSGAWMPIDAGTYVMDVSSTEGPQTNARVTVPDGWRGWWGPNRILRHNRGYVGVLVMDVDSVAERPCLSGSTGMVRVGDQPQQLVRALTRIPRNDVTIAPEPDDRFGFPGTHLQLKAGPNLDCPHHDEFLLWATDSYLIQSASPPYTLDLWVIDVDGHTVTVSATSEAGSPPWLLHELNDVVASIQFDPAET